MQRVCERVHTTSHGVRRLACQKDLAYCQLHCLVPGAFPVHGSVAYGTPLELPGLRKLFDYFNARVRRRGVAQQPRLLDGAALVAPHPPRI